MPWLRINNKSKIWMKKQTIFMMKFKKKAIKLQMIGGSSLKRSSKLNRKNSLE